MIGAVLVSIYRRVRLHSLCRIVGYSSEPNTKVYGEGSENFKHSFLLGMSRASDNTKDAMKKQIWRIHSVFSHVRP